MHQNFGASILHGLKSKSQLFHFQLFGPLLAFNSVFLEKKNSQLYHVYHSLFKLINNSSSFDKENYDPDSVCKSVLNQQTLLRFDFSVLPQLQFRLRRYIKQHIVDSRHLTWQTTIRLTAVTDRSHTQIHCTNVSSNIEFLPTVSILNQANML